MFIAEIIAPFTVQIGPDYLRTSSIILQFLLQIGIWICGNYGNFNVLTFFLSFIFFDFETVTTQNFTLFFHNFSIFDFFPFVLFVIWLIGSVLQFPYCSFFCYIWLYDKSTLNNSFNKLPPIKFLNDFYRTLLPFRIINSFGVFDVVGIENKNVRRVTNIEGFDGKIWRTFEFKFLTCKEKQSVKIIKE